MDVKPIVPDDDQAVARCAAQLAVTEALSRRAIAGIGTDRDKIKSWRS